MNVQSYHFDPKFDICSSVEQILININMGVRLNRGPKIKGVSVRINNLYFQIYNRKTCTILISY